MTYLENAEGGDLEDGLEAQGHIGELDLFGEAEVGVAEGADEAGDDVSEHGDHRDATVLLLDLAVPGELLRRDVRRQAPGVPEARRPRQKLETKTEEISYAWAPSCSEGSKARDFNVFFTPPKA